MPDPYRYEIPVGYRKVERYGIVLGFTMENGCLLGMV